VCVAVFCIFIYILYISSFSLSLWMSSKAAFLSYVEINVFSGILLAPRRHCLLHRGSVFCFISFGFYYIQCCSAHKELVLTFITCFFIPVIFVLCICMYVSMYVCVYVQGDQKVSVHLMITIQKPTRLSSSLFGSI
jgi:hypothetical protein